MAEIEPQANSIENKAEKDSELEALTEQTKNLENLIALAEKIGDNGVVQLLETAHE